MIEFDIHADDGKGGSVCGLNARPVAGPAMWKYVSCKRCQEKITPTKKNMTNKQAIVKAAAALGRASNQLIRSGYSALSKECDEAIIALQNCTSERQITIRDDRVGYTGKSEEWPV